MNNLWVVLLAGVLSYGLTGLMLRYALANELIDIPNHRSSHSLPTPRSGGLAFVLTFLIFLLILAGIDRLDLPFLMGLLGAGVLVAVIGFVDDCRHIAVRWRLLAHFLAAAWILYCFGGLPPLPLLGTMLDVAWLVNFLMVLYLMWLLNLYNFMDGIDGIAGVETVTVCIGGLVLYWLIEPTEVIWVVPALLLSTTMGFLFWNFPRAKIFMGDVGSGFLGLMLGALSIQATWAASELFWSWIILLGAFVVDTTVTLVRRILRREKFFEAHRSHAYQYAARKFGTHIMVTLAFAVINIIWLLPIAALVATGRVDGFLGVVIAYIPLFFLSLHFKAGAKELQDL